MLFVVLFQRLVLEFILRWFLQQIRQQLQFGWFKVSNFFNLRLTIFIDCSSTCTQCRSEFKGVSSSDTACLGCPATAMTLDLKTQVCGATCPTGGFAFNLNQNISEVFFANCDWRSLKLLSGNVDRFSMLLPDGTNMTQDQTKQFLQMRN